MSSHKFEIDKFDGSNDFTLWKVKMKAFLVQQGCATVLEGEGKLPEGLKATEKTEILARAHSAILLSLTDEVLERLLMKRLLQGYGRSWKASTRKNP